MPDPTATLEQAKGLARAGRLAEAARLCAGLTAAAEAPEPARLEALLLQADALARLGRLDQAEAALREGLEAHPARPEPRLALALLLARRGRVREALDTLEPAIPLAPQRADLHFHRGRLLEQIGRWSEALEAFEEACRLVPGSLEAHARAAQLCARMGRRQRWLEHEEAMVRIDPGNWAVHHNRGSALLTMMRTEEALASFRRASACTAEPRPECIAGEVSALVQLGRHQEAWERLQPLLARGEPNHALGIAFADLAPHVGRVEEAIAYLRRVLEREAALNPVQRQSLHFCLGNLYDRAGNPDRAFLHLHTANEMAPRTFAREPFLEHLRQVQRWFPPGGDPEIPRARGRDPRPVLIVGMPRSGTSLTEQILACHPEVHAAGELPTLGWLSEALRERAAQAPTLAGLPQAFVDELAERYLAEAAREAGPAARITDKMPTNFLWLGTAMLALPGARVVHVQRHPLDNLLSCYKENLQGLHSYTNRLEDLAFFYRLYRRFMDHWRQALDLPLLELRYEALVERPEEQVRRLLDFLELPWDEACLRFHESRRLVRTASYDQVRRPLYRSAVGRWRRYAPYLEPLRRELAEFLDEQAPYGYR